MTIAFIGFNQWLDARVTDFSEGRAVLELAVRPEVANRSGILHGGVLATLVDVAGGLSGGWIGVPDDYQPVLTLSLTTSFLGQAAPGATVRAEGRRRGGGRRIFGATVEVTDGAGRLIATGEGMYRLPG